jgi:uncharacterized alpha/beta hydrolase family protein
LAGLIDSHSWFRTEPAVSFGQEKKRDSWTAVSKIVQAVIADCHELYKKIKFRAFESGIFQDIIEIRKKLF